MIRGAGALGGGDDLVDLGLGADVVGEDDAAELAAAVVGDAGVGGQLVPPPQDDRDAAGIEEDRLLGLLAGPAQLLVEGASPGQVGDAQCDEADSLLHRRSSVRGNVQPWIPANAC